MGRVYTFSTTWGNPFDYIRTDPTDIGDHCETNFAYSPAMETELFASRYIDFSRDDWKVGWGDHPMYFETVSENTGEELSLYRHHRSPRKRMDRHLAACLRKYG